MGSINPETHYNLDLDRGIERVAPLPPKDVVLSLRTGKVRPLGGTAKIQSGINKQPRLGRVRLSHRGLDDDERSYPPHRSPDNALFQYDSRHYEFWRSTLPPGARADLCRPGGFGENLSMAHLSEDNVCIGDTFRLGPEALVQVTMPRQPCFKLNHRFEHRRMSALTQSTGRTGWYYRVLREGDVGEGDEMVLLTRPNPTWPLSRLQHFTYHAKDAADGRICATITRLEGLSAEFITLYEKRLAAGVAEDMNGRLNGDTAMLWRTYRLVEKISLTPRVKKFVFTAEDSDVVDADDGGGDELGRFPYVRLKFGPDARFVRAYSVVSGNMRCFELGVARDDNSRGGSRFLHDELNVGDTLKVAQGSSRPSRSTEAARRSRTDKNIFVLGGIGVTAFIGEIRLLERASADLEVYYAVRSREEAAYLDHLPTERTTIYSRSDGHRLDTETVIPPLDHPHNPEITIYCCGPTSLMDACREKCQRLGYPRSHTHFEDFGGASTGTGDPFEVEIKSTGKILSVPREKSLLQVLNETGFDIEGSCLVGNCGTCMVNYCEGEVIHDGLALEHEQKKDTMLSCVSRGRGKIVVDC